MAGRKAEPEPTLYVPTAVDRQQAAFEEARVKAEAKEQAAREEAERQAKINAEHFAKMGPATGVRIVGNKPQR